MPTLIESSYLSCPAQAQPDASFPQREHEENLGEVKELLHSKTKDEKRFPAKH